MNYAIIHAKKLLKRLKRFLRRWFSRRSNQRKFSFIGLSLIAVVLFIGLVFSVDKSSKQHYTLVQRQIKLQKLKSQLIITEQQKEATEAQVKAKSQNETNLHRQIDNLNKQLQAKAQHQADLAAQVVIAKAPPPQSYSKPIQAPSYAPLAPARVAASINGCGDNFYANFIYMHESGCNTGATNSIGCFGIGQDCNGIVRSRCGYDYACQNAYFTSYSSKYGGWSGSYAFWLSHSWW